MTKFKLIYILSLILLGVLIGVALVRPALTAGEYSEVVKEHLAQTNQGYTAQFHIINREGRDTRYTVAVSFDSYSYRQEVTIPDGKIFTYARDIDPARLKDGSIKFEIYKEGETSPFEETTYYLKEGK